MTIFSGWPKLTGAISLIATQRCYQSAQREIDFHRTGSRRENGNSPNKSAALSADFLALGVSAHTRRLGLISRPLPPPRHRGCEHDRKAKPEGICCAASQSTCMLHVFELDLGTFQSLLHQLHLKVLNILVVDDTLSYRKHLEPQVAECSRWRGPADGHIAFCTAFDPYKFANTSLQPITIKQLDGNFADGALAAKIWKNIGMEIKTPAGKFVMPDDPAFDPIYEDIARHGKTLMAHVAEPDVAWGPPDPSDPSWTYYQENPQWFLYGKKGFPSKQQILLGA